YFALAAALTPLAFGALGAIRLWLTRVPGRPGPGAPFRSLGAVFRAGGTLEDAADDEHRYRQRRTIRRAFLKAGGLLVLAGIGFSLVIMFLVLPLFNSQLRTRAELETA